MDDNEVFVPSEESIRDIVRNEGLHAMATANPPEGNRKVSLVGKKPGGKRNGKPRQSRPAHREGKRSRSKSAKRSNQPRSSSKNARGKGSGHVK